MWYPGQQKLKELVHCFSVIEPQASLWSLSTHMHCPTASDFSFISLLPLLQPSELAPVSLSAPIYISHRHYNTWSTWSTCAMLCLSARTEMVLSILSGNYVVHCQTLVCASATSAAARLRVSYTTSETLSPATWCVTLLRLPSEASTQTGHSFFSTPCRCP